MMGRILSMKEHQQELLSTARMSLPFNYNHLLTVVVMVTLLLLSYGAALTSSALAPGVFILTAFLFLGIMEAAHSLWDPFQDGVPHRWTQDGRSHGSTEIATTETCRKRPAGRFDSFAFK